MDWSKKPMDWSKGTYPKWLADVSRHVGDVSRYVFRIRLKKKASSQGKRPFNIVIIGNLIPAADVVHNRIGLVFGKGHQHILGAFGNFNIGIQHFQFIFPRTVAQGFYPAFNFGE